MLQVLLSLFGQRAADIALDMIQGKIFGPNDHTATGTGPTSVESRVLEAERRLDDFSQTQAKQTEELRKVLRFVALRAAVALWIGIVSLVLGVGLLAVMVLKS
jgi:Flp pilus assembly protein TadB